MKTSLAFFHLAARAHWSGHVCDSRPGSGTQLRSAKNDGPDLLRDGTLTTPRDRYFVRREGGLAYGGRSYEALIRGDWKLLQNNPFSPLELYNLKDDPQEKNNLASTNKKVVNEIATALRAHIQRGGATPWQKPKR